MKKINIFTSSYTVRFAHQLDKTLFPESYNRKHGK